jgi:hypothetical protein
MKGLKRSSGGLVRRKVESEFQRFRRLLLKLAKEEISDLKEARIGLNFDL